VSTIHAPFLTEVECKMASVITSEFEWHDPLIRLDAQNAVRPSPLKDRPLKSGPELQIGVMQLAREGSPQPGSRLPQAKLSRSSNQIARGRIRQFEPYMPSHAVDRHCRPASPPLPASPAPSS
jgi:hypothetical protein